MPNPIKRFIDWWKGEEPSKETPQQGDPKWTPIEETDEGKLFNQIATSGCPDCGTNQFAPGPRGGMMQNFACENGHRFNISTELGIAHRI